MSKKHTHTHIHTHTQALCCQATWYQHQKESVFRFLLGGGGGIYQRLSCPNQPSTQLTGLRYYQIHMRRLLLLLAWTIGGNPVPIPGMGRNRHFQPQRDCGQTLITDFAKSEQPLHQGEGCLVSTDMAGAEPWTPHFIACPANSGYPPPANFGSSRCPYQQTAVQKRSYQRACKRALQFGEAKYHGKIFRIHDFPRPLVQKIQQQMPPIMLRQRTVPPSQLSHSRIRVLNWNAGGMAQGTLFELTHWLRFRQVDIVTVTETRWSFEKCWTDSDWAYIHCPGHEPRSGGILTLISKKLIHPDQIGYDSLIPGH